ncbi:MAG: hypothetical protein PHX70_06815 [Clostridium sp.]|nr:hypothetical protein [Clostridium sp.]
MSHHHLPILLDEKHTTQLTTDILLIIGFSRESIHDPKELSTVNSPILSFVVFATF